mgnify:CR=1 FL=1
MGCRSGGDALASALQLAGQGLHRLPRDERGYNTNIATLKKATFMVIIIVRCITTPAANAPEPPPPIPDENGDRQLDQQGAPRRGR